MSAARRRLAGLAAALVALYVALVLVAGIDEDALRGAVEPLGLWAVPAYVALSAVLGVALVPGALLATAAGLLFGPALGTLASLAAATLGALLALVIARRVGREGIAELESRRLRATEELLERRGVIAVIVQRLLPAVPDGPFNHAAGLLRVRPWHLALGTVIGSAPRALSYTVLGDALGGRDAGQALLGGVLLAATGVLGLALGVRELRAGRRRRRAVRLDGAHPARGPQPLDE